MIKKLLFLLLLSSSAWAVTPIVVTTSTRVSWSGTATLVGGDRGIIAVNPAQLSVTGGNTLLDYTVPVSSSIAGLIIISGSGSTGLSIAGTSIPDFAFSVSSAVTFSGNDRLVIFKNPSSFTAGPAPLMDATIPNGQSLTVNILVNGKTK